MTTFHAPAADRPDDYRFPATGSPAAREIWATIPRRNEDHEPIAVKGRTPRTGSLSGVLAATPGLAPQSSSRYGTADASTYGWKITHVRSGREIGVTFSTRKDALRTIAAMGALDRTPEYGDLADRIGRLADGSPNPDDLAIVMAVRDAAYSWAHGNAGSHAGPADMRTRVATSVASRLRASTLRAG